MQATSKKALDKSDMFEDAMLEEIAELVFGHLQPILQIWEIVGDARKTLAPGAAQPGG
jgi:hypothetical protein